MYRSLALIALIGLISGCAASPASMACTVSGHKQIVIHYVKDREIRVTSSQSLPTIAQGQELRFKLNGSRGTLVTVSGKDGDSAWIAGTGTNEPGDDTISICVPPGQMLGEYGYEVRVAGIGFLDPRVRVITGR